MNKLSAQKCNIILLKYQRFLNQEEKKDTNQCGIIGFGNTSDRCSIP